MPDTVLRAARDYVGAGLSVIPIRPDGSKSPACGQWQSYQKQKPTESELRQLFRNGCGIAIIGGAVSGNLEILDFDQPGAFDRWRALLPPGIDALVTALPRVSTPAEGMHLYYRCNEIAGSAKLARSAVPFTDPTGKSKTVIIETKGEGGYVIAPPSPHKCHKAGRPYARVGASELTAIPTIRPEQRRVLLDAARSMDEVATPEAPKADKARDDDGPGVADDFCARGLSIATQLESAGWTKLAKKCKNNDTLWRRPGKDDKGGSASEKSDGLLLNVFSTNAEPLEARGYNGFQLYAALKHGGSASAAAKALYAEGYGRHPAALPEPPPDDTPHTVSGDGEKRPWLGDERRSTPLQLQSMADIGAEWRSMQTASGVPTQITALNEALGGGLPAAQVTTILAYTGVGKSEFARQLARHAAAIGHGVVHVDVELGPARLYERELSQRSQVPPSHMRDPDKMNAQEAEALQRVTQQIDKQTRTVYLCPRGAPKLEDLAELIHKGVDQVRDAGDDVVRPPLVILDSAQRLSFGAPGQEPRMQMIYFMAWVESLAKQTRAAVIMVSEQKRGKEGKAPAADETLTSGAESRSLEFVSDVMLGLIPEEKDTEQVCGAADLEWERRVQILIAKSRSGQHGYLPDSVVFTGPCWGMRVEQRLAKTLEAEIVEALVDAPDGLSNNDLARKCQRQRAAVTSACVLLNQSGRISREGSHRYGRWRLSESSNVANGTTNRIQHGSDLADKNRVTGAVYKANSGNFESDPIHNFKIGSASGSDLDPKIRSCQSGLFNKENEDDGDGSD